MSISATTSSGTTAAILELQHLILYLSEKILQLNDGNNWNHLFWGLRCSISFSQIDTLNISWCATLWKLINLILQNLSKLAYSLEMNLRSTDIKFNLSIPENHIWSKMLQNYCGFYNSSTKLGYKIQLEERTKQQQSSSNLRTLI